MKSNNHNRAGERQEEPSERNYRDNRDDNDYSRYNAYGREYNSGEMRDINRERPNYQGRSHADNNYQSRSPFDKSTRYSSRYNEYLGSDRGIHKNDYGSRNIYVSNDFDRYKNYEGNSGRDNYQDYDAPSGNIGNETTHNRTRYSEKPGRDWDSRESGYYNGASTNRGENERDYPYGGNRRQDDRDWAKGRNQNSSYS